MLDEDSSFTTQTYLESASPEEQKEFAHALLSARSRMNLPGPRDVPASMVLASRILFSCLMIFYAVSTGWSPDLVLMLSGFALVGAAACFPNQIAGATGRLGLETAVSRVSPPWGVFVIAWFVLLLPVLLSAVTAWFAAG